VVQWGVPRTPIKILYDLAKWGTAYWCGKREPAAEAVYGGVSPPHGSMELITILTAAIVSRVLSTSMANRCRCLENCPLSLTWQVAEPESTHEFF